MQTTNYAQKARTPAAQVADTEFSFAEEFKEPGQEPVLSPTRYITLMKLDVATFAMHAHVHRNTVTRAPQAASVQSYLRQSIRVLTAAYRLSGDPSTAMNWFRNEPLAPFDFRTAEQLVNEGRADDVVRLIDSYQGGAAG